MNSFILFNRQARSLAVIAVMLLAMVVPAIASAAQVTERSIALSSSTKAATGVTYQVNFTADGAAGAFIVDFCSNTPLIGEDCTAPTGFSVSSATTSTAGFTRTVLDANTIQLTGTVAADANIAVELAGVTNPTNAGPLYARIVTYTNGTDAAGYTPGNPDAVGANIDQGGVAVSITDSVSVSGAVLESMTFCVSGETIAANCIGGGDAAPALTPPTLVLGQDVGGVIALNSAAVYSGTINTQISTNASRGAVINLKSNATGCGGLLRAGEESDCDIIPANGGISAGEAEFGVMTGADTTTADGTIRAVPASGYSDSVYSLNYAAGNATGVTSTYGDPFLDTNNAPANNMNMPITFGASAGNNTPAGLYSADLSLIATGKF